MSPPPFPLYAEMVLSYPELSADADTTPCPAPLALAGMAVQFYEWAQKRERSKRGPDNQDDATRWDSVLAAAELAYAIADSDWNTPKKPNVRKHFAGRAYA